MYNSICNKKKRYSEQRSCVIDLLVVYSFSILFVLHSDEQSEVKYTTKKNFGASKISQVGTYSFNNL